MFLDQITVPAERFGDIPVGTAFICEDGLLIRGDYMPRPCILVKVAGDGHNCERVFSSDSLTAQDPTTLCLAPDAHVIVVH